MATTGKFKETPNQGTNHEGQTFILSDEEVRAIEKMRNKRSISYNLRVSQEELDFFNEVKTLLENNGYEFKSNTDFMYSCVKMARYEILDRIEQGKDA